MKANAATTEIQNVGETSKLTKREMDGIFWRWFFTAEFSYNYETQQAGGLVHAMGPALRKIYKDDNEYRDAVLSYYSVFNTHKYMANIILGACLAIEEKHEENGPEATREAAVSVKTALMGPLAGVGDSLFSSVPMTIFGAIAAYMALQGNVIGVVFGLIFGIAMIFVRKWLFDMGYKQGTNLLSNFSGTIGNLINAFGVLGLMVVGALIPTTVSLSSALVFTQGSVKMSIQSILDGIIPNLLPAVLVGVTYWLLGRKKITVTKIILIMFVVAFAGYNLKLFA